MYFARCDHHKSMYSFVVYIDIELILINYFLNLIFGNNMYGFVCQKCKCQLIYKGLRVSLSRFYNYLEKSIRENRETLRLHEYGSWCSMQYVALVPIK